MYDAQYGTIVIIHVCIDREELSYLANSVYRQLSLENQFQVHFSFKKIVGAEIASELAIKNKRFLKK